VEEKIKNMKFEQDVPQSSGGEGEEAILSDELITEEEKTELWDEFVINNKSTQELQNINPGHLIEVDWKVMKDLDNLSEDDIKMIEEGERQLIHNSSTINPSRSHFYACIRNQIINKGARRKLDKRGVYKEAA